MHVGDIVWLPLKVTHLYGDPDGPPSHHTVEGTLPDGQRIMTNAPLNARPGEALAAAPTVEAVLGVAGDHAPARVLPIAWGGRPTPAAVT